MKRNGPGLTAEKETPPGIRRSRLRTAPGVALLALLLAAPVAHGDTGKKTAAPATPAAASPAVHAQVQAQMDKAWQQTWTRFYSPQTNLFYDYLSSYEPGKELAHLPEADEVARQFPNPCGYSTGMEDGMILGGAMLSVLVDRHAVEPDNAAVSGQAEEVYQGLKMLLTVHGVPGFPARGVSPKDAKKQVYINSSRDQVTHAVHGLWRYYHSDLATADRKAEIRGLMRAVADRMIRYVTPEHGFDFLRLDGTPCGLGICKMWEVKPHEAARLPMIYAAAWDVTGDEVYQTHYLRYLKPAIEQSQTPGEDRPAYALLQMQCSLELLLAVEKDEANQKELRKAMETVSRIARKRSTHVLAELRRMTPEQRAVLGPDWRTVPVWKNQKGYMNPQWGDYRKVWHALREMGESSLVPLMDGPQAVTPAQRAEMLAMWQESDYDHMSSCGIVYHLAAYWKARKLGLE